MVVDNGNKATLSGVEDKKQFSVSLNNKAFKVLTDNLYADKIGAGIRELSSNAYDAHKENGNLDKPWDIHVPSILEPYFSIRDYGKGLAHEDVLQLYTTFFSSTKDQTNEFVGGYGLGSKSPFAYVSNFVVNSYYNGLVTSYAMYLDNGAPTVSVVGSQNTEEPNGLEIRYAVDPRDFAEFERKIKIYSEFYDPLPKGIVGLEPPTKLVDNIYRSSLNQYNGGILIGKVPYEVRGFFNGLYVEVDVGTFEVSVSRETLSIDYSVANILYQDTADKIIQAIINKELQLTSYLMNLYYLKLPSTLKKLNIGFRKIKGYQDNYISVNSVFYFNDSEYSIHKIKRFPEMNTSSILLESDYTYEELLDLLPFDESLLIKISSLKTIKNEKKIKRCKTPEDYQQKYEGCFMYKDGWRFKPLDNIDFKKRTYCLTTERGSLTPVVNRFMEFICPDAVIVEKSKKKALKAFPRRIELDDSSMSILATKKLSSEDCAKVVFTHEKKPYSNYKGYIKYGHFYDYDLAKKKYDIDKYNEYLDEYLADQLDDCKKSVTDLLNELSNRFEKGILERVITYEIH